ncbi:hypothetical protein M5689_004930 [Euphorbia peplus]|nr:hypothetical protein M5689_004930 [Euphorbia peplus]
MRVQSTYPKDYYSPPEGEDAPFFSSIGEDAHFICSDKNVIGLADGVGSWSRKGIDAGKYSQCLTKQAKFVVETIQVIMFILNKSLIDRACKLAKLARTGTNKQLLGSSTACIIALNDNSLDYANVGDSGLMVFRDNQMIHRSPVPSSNTDLTFPTGLAMVPPWTNHLMLI